MLAAGIWIAWRQSRPSKAGPTPVFTRLTSDSGFSADPALSPEGKLLAFASDRSGKGNLDIWVQQVGGAAPIRVTEGARLREPAFSDGTGIAFRFEREGVVYVVPAFGGAPRRIAPLGRRPRFSADGKWIANWTGGGGAPLTARRIQRDGGRSALCAVRGARGRYGHSRLARESPRCAWQTWLVPVLVELVSGFQIFPGPHLPRCCRCNAVGAIDNGRRAV